MQNLKKFVWYVLELLDLVHTSRQNRMESNEHELLIMQ